jgi:hypothetical protein
MRPGASACCRLRLKLRLRQSFVRGAVDDIASGMEARAVAGAVPGLLAAVPVHDAAKVRAGGGQRVQLSRRIAIERKLPKALAHNGAFAGANVGNLVDLADGRVLREMAGDLRFLRARY